MSRITSYISVFPGSKRLHFVCAVVFAVTMTSYGFASAEQGPNGPSPQTGCDSVKKRSCDELVQDNILWRLDQPDNPASKHWLQKNIDDLCACTSDPYSTVNCFQIQVNNNRRTWQEAIATCRAKP